jgi:hypothetical protein
MEEWLEEHLTTAIKPETRERRFTKILTRLEKGEFR